MSVTICDACWAKSTTNCSTTNYARRGHRVVLEQNQDSQALRRVGPDKRKVADPPMKYPFVMNKWGEASSLLDLLAVQLRQQYKAAFQDSRHALVFVCHVG